MEEGPWLGGCGALLGGGENDSGRPRPPRVPVCRDRKGKGAGGVGLGLGCRWALSLPPQPELANYFFFVEIE